MLIAAMVKYTTLVELHWGELPGNAGDQASEGLGHSKAWQSQHGGIHCAEPCLTLTQTMIKV